MSMRKLFPFILMFVLFVFAESAYSFTISNFNNPESMVVDPEDGSYYVSNVNGGPAEKDGNGFISKISQNGNIVIQKFIGGKKEDILLNAPKGLAIVGGYLYVTDIDTVKGFDKETGIGTVMVDLSGWNAKFLNDVTADGDGALYVSDLMADRIYKIDTKRNHEVTIFKEGKELGKPNGLVVNPRSKNLMLAGWSSGQILEIDRMGKIHIVKKGLSSLDGIDFDNEGNIYVANHEKGEIYKIAYFGRGALTTFLSGLTTPADISCDRRRRELLIPSMKGNTVLTVPLVKTVPSSTSKE